MRSRVLVLQHIACEPPAVYGQVLQERSFDIDTVHLYDGQALPADVDAYDAMIAMGGPMGAMDDHVHPWLADERALIASAVEGGTPVWGVCLGAQLLAGALDAAVYRGAEPEVDVGSVHLTEAAQDDPVFGELGASLEVFQWHGDTFDLPDGAVRLASNAGYANQAFAIGSAYGLQFHVEITTELAAEWCAVPEYNEALETIMGVGAAPRMLAQLALHQGTLETNARTLFERWLAAFVSS